MSNKTNFGEGLWMLPTRGRFEGCQRILDSMVSCGGIEDIVVLADRDDVTPYENMTYGKNVVIIRDEFFGMDHKMRWFLEQYPTLDWYGVATDDTIIRTADFERKMLSSLMRPSDKSRYVGFVSCEDLYKAPARMAGTILFHGALHRVMGKIVPEDFFHCFIDDIWEMIGRDFDIWIPRLDVVCEHLHWTNNKSVQDETYQRANAFFQSDKRRFRLWCENEKLDAYKRIRQFILDGRYTNDISKAEVIINELEVAKAHKDSGVAKNTGWAV